MASPGDGASNVRLASASLTLGGASMASEATFTQAFVSTWKTDNAGVSTSTQVTLPLIDSGAVNCVVDWGDGTQSAITAFDDTDATHTYGSAGTYQIAITGTIEGWQFNNGGDRLKLLSISNWGPFDMTDSAAFYGCANLVCTATDAPTISSTSLDSAFRGCTLFNNAAIGTWDVSAVTSMLSTLRSCEAFDQDLSAWDVGALTNATNFMNSANALSTANYDALLIAWAAQTVTGGVAIHFGDAQYSAGAAATARASLVTDDSWIITDGGQLSAGFSSPMPVLSLVA